MVTIFTEQFAFMACVGIGIGLCGLFGQRFVVSVAALANIGRNLLFWRALLVTFVAGNSGVFMFITQ